MSDYQHNNMTEPRKADEECITIFSAVKEEILKKIHEINREDDRHGLHEMDKLKRISEYTPTLYATEDVAFGRYGYMEEDRCYLMKAPRKDARAILTAYSRLLSPFKTVNSNYFAKIHLGDGKYIHARAHKGLDKQISFYSLWTEPDGAIWDEDTPLKYFID